MTPYQRHPRFQKFAADLAAQAPVGKLPGRQHVGPIEIPRLPPNLSLALPGREHIRLKRIVVPLASDGETIDMRIGVHAFADP